jgi:predicted metal-binding membrane protein
MQITPMVDEDMARDRAFLATSAILFVASAVATVYWCRSMSASMIMPGGWTMSMAWMRMSGQTWLGAAASFMGMWVVMMVAMMLPSLVPMLLSYRESIRRPAGTRLGALTALAAAGYLLIWVIFGAAVYPLGLLFTAAEMRSQAIARSVPIATGVVLMLAGCVQLSAWKARQLRRCQTPPACGQLLPTDARSAWQYGHLLGAHCCLCCSGFMMAMLVTGVMNLGVMAIVTAAITVERLSPRPQHAFRVAGIGIIAAGAFMIARALSLA